MGCCESSDAGDEATDDRELLREEDAVAGTVQYSVGDPRFVQMPKWVCILLDTTGSMNLPVSQSDGISRIGLVRDVIGSIVWQVRLITFNGIEGGADRGFMHPANLDREWASVQCLGGTHIMDGWRAVIRAYEARFADLPKAQWPLLLCLIITDGELQDGREFEQHLKHVQGRAFVEIALLGYGEDHDRAYAHYQNIQRSHPHVRCSVVRRGTRAEEVSGSLLRMVDPRAMARTAASPGVGVVAPYQQPGFGAPGYVPPPAAGRR